MKFSIKDFFIKCDQNPQFLEDFVTFTKEILNGKLNFLYSVGVYYAGTRTFIGVS